MLAKAISARRFADGHPVMDVAPMVGRNLDRVDAARIDGVDELEHAAINNGVSDISIFNFFTIYHLFFDHFDGASLRPLLLFFCKLQIASCKLALQCKQLTPLLVVLLCLLRFNL